MKKMLSGLLVLTVLALGLLAVSPVNAQTEKTISVVGKGVVTMEPDIVSVQIAVSTEKESVSDALNENTNAVIAIKNAIMALGVAEEDIKTEYYSLYSSQKSFRDSSAPSDAYIYSVTYGFSIRLHEVGKLNQVLDASIKNGANTINSMNYDSSKRDAIVEEARNLAIEDAMKQAQAIAEKLGVKLGDVISFSMPDNQNYYGPYSEMNYGLGGGGSAPISSGNLSISSQVNMTFAYTAE